MAARELSDAEVFGSPSRELTDAEVFGTPTAKKELSDAEVFSSPASKTEDRPGLIATSGASLTQAVLGISRGIFETPETVERMTNPLVKTLESRRIPTAFSPIYKVPLLANYLAKIIKPVTSPIADKIGESQTALPQLFKPFAEVGRLAKEADDSVKTAIETGNLDPLLEVVKNPKQWASAIANAAPSLYAAIKSGGSIPFIAWMEGMETATDAKDFEKLTGKKISDEKFTQAVTLTAALNTVLEKFGLDKIRAAWKVASGPQKRVLGRVLNGAVETIVAGQWEGFTELAQQINTNLQQKLAYDKDKNIFAGAIQAYMGGAGSGTIAAGAGRAVSKTETTPQTQELTDQDVGLKPQPAQEPTPTAKPPVDVVNKYPFEGSLPEAETIPETPSAEQPTEETKPLYSRKGEDKTAVDVFEAIASKEQNFQYKTSKATELNEIVNDMAKGSSWQAAKRGNQIVLAVPKPTESGVDYSEFMTIHNTDTDTPYVTIGDPSEKGKEGSRAYQIAMTWAHNNGKKLIPDRVITVVNRLRRTEAMISSAMRHKTTRHLEPHPDQYVGLLSDEDYAKLKGESIDKPISTTDAGVQPKLLKLKGQFWTQESPSNTPEQNREIYRSNVYNLLKASSELAHRRQQDLARFTMDKEGRIHDTDTGKTYDDLSAVPQSQEEIDRGIGRSTRLRAIVARSFLRPEGEVLRGTERTPAPAGPVREPVLREGMVLEDRGQRGVLATDDLDRIAQSPAVTRSLYSKSPKTSGLTTESVKTIIEPILSKWENGPEVVVVQSVADIPDSATPHDVEGAYIGNGRIYLVADNLNTKERVLQVLAHEAIGHAAMEDLFGKDLKYILDGVRYLEKTSQAVRKAAQQVDKTQPRLSEQDRAREVIAVMAERGHQNNVVRRAMAAIRRFLRSIGIALEFSDIDLAGMLKAAEKHLEGGRKITGQAQPAYSRKTGYTDKHETRQSRESRKLSPDEDAIRTVTGGRPRQGWHRATRVRGSNGKPLAAARGARLRLTAKHFLLDALGYNTRHPTSGLGVWSTLDHTEAPRFGPIIEKFYLDIRNPKIFTVGVNDLPDFDTVQQAHRYRESLRAKGHDGIALSMRGIGGTVHFVAFDAEQVIVIPEQSILFSRRSSEDGKDTTNFASRALQRLGGALGIAQKGVEVIKPEAARQPGLLNPFRSPNKVAEKFPVFRPYFASAERAHDVQERLRLLFLKRLAHVDELLREGRSKIFGRKQYQKNVELLQDIRLTEDMLGIDFTDEVLRSEFNAPESVIKAKKSLRSVYNHALTIINQHREGRGKTPVSSRGGYVPHFFHNYFIIADGEVIGSARRLSEASRMGNDALRAGKKNVIVRPKQFKFPGEDVQAAVIGDIDYFKMQKTLEEKHDLTLAEANSLMNDLVRRRGRSRFVGNFLRRKGAKGFEQDLAWVDRHYFNMVARYTAMDFFKSRTISRFEREFGAFDKAHKGIAQYIKNYMNDMNGVPTAVEDLMNSTITRTPVLGNFLGTYLGDRPSLQLAGMVTGTVAIAKLGLYNAASALVNATQLIAVQTLIGPISTANGIRLALQAEAVRLGRKVGVLEQAHSDLGVLKQAGVDYAQGLESGSGYSKVHQLGKVFSATTAFFQGVERLLRQTAVLGAYHKYLKQHPGKGKEALAYAKQVNNRANYDYSIVDAPSFIRRSGPLGQILFQFKKYPVKTLELVASLRGAEHARFWIPLFVMAGYFAFPGMDALSRLLKALFDFDMELELKKELLDWAGDDKEKMAVAKTIFYGVFSQEKLGGIDLSRRIGHGDFIPSELSDLFGPSISSVVRAVQLSAREEWIGALKAMATAPGNIVEVMASDGEITDPWRRGRLSARLTSKELVAKGLGFRPVQEALEADVSRIIQYETKQTTMARQRVIDQIIIGAKEGERAQSRNDEEGLRNAERRITVAIERAEKYGIPITAEQVKQEIVSKNLTKAERAWLGSSKIVKARIGRVMEAYQTETEGRQ